MLQTQTGYSHSDYAQSLSEFGFLIRLPYSQGWCLKRKIPGFSYLDAMGCYPIFTCVDWLKLKKDIELLNGGIVSLSLVTDPFGNYNEHLLRECFRDMVTPFKQHYVIDLERKMEAYISNHNKRYARKAIQNLHIEKCENPMDYIDDWVKLYANLIKRHNIQGIVAFSRNSFEQQFHVPGIVAFRAVYKDITVGILLWYLNDDVGYYHLGAHSADGYEMRASFGLFWYAIKYFASNGLHWLNLGAGAGINRNGMDGLSRFKRGWSTGTRTSYFCGQIFDHDKYSEIIRKKGFTNTNYFPAYRKGEFGN